MRAAQRRVTDFNVGSVNRTMLEACGIEVDELYQAYAQGLIESIPVALYRGFEFDLKAAQAASGIVVLRARPGHPAPVSVPTGFLVASSSAQYQVAQPVSIPVGQTEAEALVVCTTDGPAGNAQPGDIASLVGSLVDLVGVSNPQAVANGRGIETNEERKLRFIEYVRALARGTAQSCRYAARLAEILDPRTGIVTERVARVEVQETPGHTDMWIHNGAGNTSDALLARATELVLGGWTDPATGFPVPGYDPVGARLDVMKMGEIAVDVALRVQVPPSSRSDALRGRLAAAVSGTVRGVRNGGRLLPIDLVNAALALRAPVQGAEVDAPLVSVPCPISSVLVPGGVEIEWM